MFFTSTWLLILSAISETCGATADEHKQKWCKKMLCSVIDVFLEVFFLVLGSALFTSLQVACFYRRRSAFGSSAPRLLGQNDLKESYIRCVLMFYQQTSPTARQDVLQSRSHCFCFGLHLCFIFSVWYGSQDLGLTDCSVLFSFQEDKTRFLNVSVSLILLFSLANSLSPPVWVCLLIFDKD